MIDRKTRAVAVLAMFAVLPFLSACASGGGGDGGSLYQEISREEIAQVDVADAWELIQRQRPAWLRGSGTVLLYQDGTRVGQGVGIQQVLRGISLQGIQEIRWVHEAEARRLPQAPSGSVRGAILITTR